MTPIEKTLAALESNGCNPRRSGSGWGALCPHPNHDDHNASLTLSEAQDGKVLLKCHKGDGCPLSEIVAALSPLEMGDLFPSNDGKTTRPARDMWTPAGYASARYRYTDADGNHLFDVMRVEIPGKPKDFIQRRPDATRKGGWRYDLGDIERPLYRLRKVTEAVSDGQTVFVVEGEKDADAVSSRTGAVATCNPHGAAKWLENHTATLTGADVVIVADKDDRGRQHAALVAKSLNGVAERVRIVEALTGKDAFDHLAAGHTLEQLTVVSDTANGTTPPDAWAPSPATNTNTSPPAETSTRNEVRPAVDVDRMGIVPIIWSELWTDEPVGEDWCIEPLLPRGRHVGVFAYQGAGKSLLALEISAAKANGRSILGHPPQSPANVLYLDLEMSRDDLRDRLSDLGYGPDDDLERLAYFQLPTLPPLDTVEGGDVLMAIVNERRPELVVIDTMARVVQGEENSADTYRNFYSCTGCRLKAAGVALFRLDHAGKDPTRGQRGSSSKGDDLDVIWRLTVVEDQVKMTRTKTRFSYVPAEVVLTREIDPTLRHVLAPTAYPPSTSEVAQLLDDLGVPVDATATSASAALTRNRTGRRKAVVLAALKYRRRSGNRTGNRSQSECSEPQPEPPYDDSDGEARRCERF